MSDLANADLLLDSFASDFFLNVPNPPLPVNPVNYQQIQTAQQQQQGVQQLPQFDPVRYSLQPFGQAQLVCYREPNAHNWRIVVPNNLLSHLVHWYHSVLHHAGTENLKRSLNAVFWHPHMNKAVEERVHFCPICQQLKLSGRGYGEMPPREAKAQPWHEVAVDTIGPWTVSIQGQEVRFYAVTLVDTVTNLVELVRIDTPSARNAATATETGWLFRYPRPVRMVHDQGPEYNGMEFSNLMNQYGIEDVPTSVANPQANAICERMHQVVGNLLRTLLHVNPPQNFQNAAAIVDYALATASYALRATVHRTLGISPGALVFHRDMLIDVPYVANLLLLRDKRQALIDYNLRRENNRRRNFDYRIGEYVLELKRDPTKMGIRTTGPYRIERVHANGTLTIRRGQGLTDRINIRRLRPFFRR